MTQIKNAVAEAARRIHHEGLVKAGEGNVSVRLEGTEEMLITPTRNKYVGLTAEEIVHIRFDGEKLSDGRDASSEYRLHAAVYRARPRVGAVVHTHSPEASAHAVLHKPIPLIMEEMAHFMGYPIPCAAYARTGTDVLPVAAVQAMGKGNAVLLANHGILFCGRDLDYTVHIAEMAEKLALIHARSLMLGVPVPVPETHAVLLTQGFLTTYATFA